MSLASDLIKKTCTKSVPRSRARNKLLRWIEDNLMEVGLLLTLICEQSSTVEDEGIKRGHSRWVFHVNYTDF